MAGHTLYVEVMKMPQFIMLLMSLDHIVMDCANGVHDQVSLDYVTLVHDDKDCISQDTNLASLKHIRFIEGLCHSMTTTSCKIASKHKMATKWISYRDNK